VFDYKITYILLIIENNGIKETQEGTEQVEDSK